MAIRKTIILCFILFLSSGFFVESMTADLCFCGRCLPDEMQDRADMKAGSSLQEGSSGGIFKECRLRCMNPLKSIHFSKQTISIKFFNTITLTGSGSRVFPLNGICAPDASFGAARVFRSRPVYLQDLSFRC